MVKTWIHALHPFSPPAHPDLRFRQARQQLLHLQYFLKGTVSKRRMQCGQPQLRLPLRCLPAAWPLLRMDPKGKTVNVKLSSQAAPLYQAATQQHRQLKAALAKVERLARTAFSHPGQEG
jgi:hypothetical protein